MKVIESRSRSQVQKSMFACPVHGQFAFNQKVILFTSVYIDRQRYNDREIRLQ